MTIRKRRQPTPGFKLPPPYSPVTGEHAPLSAQGVFPYVAMMQVAAEDTHKDYVICRGHDVRYNKFYDYAAGDPNKPGIAVAKPYGMRRHCVYRVGQIFAAVIPLQTPNPQPESVPWRVGTNPGVATVSDGHPADLYEEVTELYDDDGKLIVYMFLEGQESSMVVRATECILPFQGGTVQPQQWNSTNGCWEDSDYEPFDIVDPMGWLLAITDDCFKIESQHGCGETNGGNYMPAFPFGLTRIVKIKKDVNMIGCGSCGLATIMKRVPEGTGGVGSRCNMDESDCDIQVCNMSYRNIACDADEYAMAQIIPGACCLDPEDSQGSGGCIAVLMPYPRPLSGRAIATGKICGGPSTMSDFEPTDACSDWPFNPAPTEFTNDLGLYACGGDELHVRWNDGECKWDLANVEHHFLPSTLHDVRCKEGACEIEGLKATQGIAVQQCEDCGQTNWESVIAGSYVNVVSDVDVNCSSTCEAGKVSFKRICVLCGTDDGNAPEDKAIPVATVSVLTGFDQFNTQDTNGNVVTCGLQATKKSVCIIGCAGEDEDPDTVHFSKIEPLTDAVFDCSGCPTFQPSTLGCFVLCTSEYEDVWEEQACECDPCEEPSA